LVASKRYDHSLRVAIGLKNTGRASSFWDHCGKMCADGIGSLDSAPFWRLVTSAGSLEIFCGKEPAIFPRRHLVGRKPDTWQLLGELFKTQFDVVDGSPCRTAFIGFARALQAAKVRRGRAFTCRMCPDPGQDVPTIT